MGCFMTNSISSKLDEYARQYFGEAPADSPDVDMWQPKHDLKSPPGLVGEVTKYINSQCRFPMEHLSVIAAIVSVGKYGYGRTAAYMCARKYGRKFETSFDRVGDGCFDLKAVRIK